MWSITSVKGRKEFHSRYPNETGVMINLAFLLNTIKPENRIA
jgi:hypothetical protein